MFRSITRAAIVCSVLALAQAQQQLPSGLLPPTVRFHGDISLTSATGKAAKPLSVTIRQWSVPSGRTVERFPETGFVLVQLLAGKVTTNIEGKQQNRNTGDIWIVPAGASMAVTVRREMAILETVAVQ
jgi:quercetin dioxygenase-like cupin family protein